MSNLTAAREKALNKLGISYDNTPGLYQSGCAALTALINEVLEEGAKATEDIMIADLGGKWTPYTASKKVLEYASRKLRALKLGEPE